MLTEVVVELEDRIGALADLGELLGGEGVNISALAVVRVGEDRALAHLVLEPADVAVLGYERAPTGVPDPPAPVALDAEADVVVGGVLP